jgi:Transposase IS116/IS110/IS902 family
MGRFPTPAHLASWARFAPGVKQSAGKKKGTNATGHGNPYLARVLGEAAVAAGRTSTFLGERYRRIARRRGAKRAIVAVGRSILIIVWHLLADPNLRYTTSARASTTPASTLNAPSATTSASWRPWATRSPCNPPPSRNAVVFRVRGRCQPRSPQPRLVAWSAAASGDAGRACAGSCSFRREFSATEGASTGTHRVAAGEARNLRGFVPERSGDERLCSAECCRDQPWVARRHGGIRPPTCGRLAMPVGRLVRRRLSERTDRPRSGRLAATDPDVWVSYLLTGIS